MIPRAWKRSARRFAFFAAVILPACFALFASAIPAEATVTSLSVTPEHPTTCTPTTVGVTGQTLSSCDSLIAWDLRGPEPFPEWVGPQPAYRARIVLTVRREILREIPCTAQATPYAREFPLGLLPTGLYFVSAVERVVVGGQMVDSTTTNMTFDVMPADSCVFPPCSMLSFTPSPPTPITSRCTAVGRPGGEGCFDVSLVNGVPVGGVQLEISLLDMRTVVPVPTGLITPKSVSTTGRTAPLQVAWEADGALLKIILYSTSTEVVIEPGQGPILHVCYSIGEDATDSRFIQFGKTLVADSVGVEIPPCPTFRAADGLFCVVNSAGCDLNGDGISDIRDIIHLVRCALAGDACPDTIATRADCNEDGSVDIRDVICCVRKVLAAGGTLGGEPGTPSGARPTRIGFEGAATWQTPIAGRAFLNVEPGEEFGGIEFRIDRSPGIRITGLRLAEGGAGCRLEWSRDAAGHVIAMLYREASSEPGTARIALAIEPEANGSDLEASTLRISGLTTASWTAELAASQITGAVASVPAPPLAAPAVYRARPNPFAGDTEIPFALPARGRVSLRVFDVAGRLVRTLVQGERPAGAHRAHWDGLDERGHAIPAGIYFVELSAGGAERTTRILKLR